MLFSEPKIPQSSGLTHDAVKYRVSVLFSEPKIPQSRRYGVVVIRCTCFSALQRAENSSIWCRGGRALSDDRVSVLFSEPKIPQSGSAWTSSSSASISFSALQRAENSSIMTMTGNEHSSPAFQCSSASRKFLTAVVRVHPIASAFVSVLFSEPKIPQSRSACRIIAISSCFSALQRAENSSI